MQIISRRRKNAPVLSGEWLLDREKCDTTNNFSEKFIKKWLKPSLFLKTPVFIGISDMKAYILSRHYAVI